MPRKRLQAREETPRSHRMACVWVRSSRHPQGLAFRYRRRPDPRGPAAAELSDSALRSRRGSDSGIRDHCLLMNVFCVTAGCYSEFTMACRYKWQVTSCCHLLKYHLSICSTHKSSLLGRSPRKKCPRFEAVCGFVVQR